MGKSQKKRKTQAWRHNPIRVPDAHLGGGKGEGKADPGKEKQMLPVLTKLKSPEYAERTWACAAICNLIQNDPATRRLFQSRNVIGELIERLSDSVDEVVVEASGALRNLAIDGGHELCAEMFNKGIMSYLGVLIQKISGTIDSVVASPASSKTLTDAELQNRKHLLALTENVLSLLWSLAETSHKTLAAVNAVGCEGLLVKVLAGREILGITVAVAAAQAMYSLSQDNTPFKRAILSQASALEVLVTAITDSGKTITNGSAKGKEKRTGAESEADGGRELLLRLLVAGVLRNIVDPGKAADEEVNIAAITNEVIMPIINDLLNLNLAEVVGQVTTLAAQIPTESVVTASKELKNDHRSPAEVQLEQIERTLGTVIVALEILTGICAGLEDIEEDPEAVEEQADADEDEDMDDDLADEDLIALARDSTMDEGAPAIAAPTVSTPTTLSHLLSTLSLPQRLTTLASLTLLSFPPATSQPSIHPPTTSALSVLHLRALEALNNLLLTTSASAGPDSQLADMIPAQGVWDGITTIVQMIVAEKEALSAKGQEMRGEVLEQALGCLWGLAKVAPSAFTLVPAAIQLLMDAIPLLRNDTAKARTIDLLALLASRPTVTIEENQVISTFLLTSFTPPPPATPAPEILIALLNAIIDIYADETRSYDSVFTSAEPNFLQTLASSVSRVRNEVKRIDRRKDRELRTRGEEVYENLVGFVKYRRGLGR